MPNLAEEIRILQQMLVVLSTRAEDFRPVLAPGSRCYVDQLVSDIQQTRNRLTKTPTPGSVTHAKDNLASYHVHYQEILQEKEDPGHLARRDLSDSECRLKKEQEQVASMRKELSEANKQLQASQQAVATVQNKLEHQTKEFIKFKQQANSRRQNLTKRMHDLEKQIKTTESQLRVTEQHELPASEEELSKKQYRKRLFRADQEMASFRREIDRCQQNINSLMHQGFALKGQLAIANAAIESSQDRLVQSYEARTFLEQELAELKGTRNKVERFTTENNHIQYQVEQSFQSSPVQCRQPILFQREQSGPKIQRAASSRKAQETMKLQEKIKNIRKKLEDSEYNLQLKLADAAHFQTTCDSLQKDASELKIVKASLEKEVEILQEKLCGRDKDITNLKARKYEMHEELKEYKKAMEAHVFKNTALEEENTGIKRKWKEVAQLMTSITKTWEELEEEEERMTASEELFRDNAAILAARFQQDLRNPFFPAKTSSRTHQIQDKGKGTITRGTELDPNYPALEMPSAPLKQKEESKIPGYTIVKEHYRKVVTNKKL